jgi:hypothetical protein
MQTAYHPLFQPRPWPARRFGHSPLGEEMLRSNCLSIRVYPRPSAVLFSFVGLLKAIRESNIDHAPGRKGSRMLLFEPFVKLTIQFRCLLGCGQGRALESLREVDSIHLPRITSDGTPGGL